MERNLLEREVDKLLNQDFFFKGLFSPFTSSSQTINLHFKGDGKYVTFPSGEKLRITSGKTGEGEKHYDPHSSGMPLLDVSGTNLDKYLSKNFKAKEFLVFGSETKYKEKYKEAPDKSLLRLDPVLVLVLQNIREHVGKPVKITSGYRHHWYNEILAGAADRSQHLIGRAADIVIADMTPLQVAKAAIDAAGEYIFGIGVYNSFTHIDVRCGKFAAWESHIDEVKKYRSAKNLPDRSNRCITSKGPEITNGITIPAFPNFLSSAIRQITAQTDWAKTTIDQRRKYVMSVLVKKYNYPPNAAAGIVGNLESESNIIPNRVEGSVSANPMEALGLDGKRRKFSVDEIMGRSVPRRYGPQKPGIGLAQWTYSTRRAGLFQHSYNGKKYGGDILFDMDAQIDYLVKELRKDFARLNKILQASSVSVNQASDAFLRIFERPGSIIYNNKVIERNSSGVPDDLKAKAIEIYNKRARQSQAALEAYKKGL